MLFNAFAISIHHDDLIVSCAVSHILSSICLQIHPLNKAWNPSISIFGGELCYRSQTLNDYGVAFWFWSIGTAEITLLNKTDLRKYYRSRFLARWLTSARAYRIGGRKLCPSVCLYVKRYLLLQFCTDYNQTWINMIWAVAAKTLLSQIFHKWRKIEVNCVYISRCAQLVSYFWNAGMHTK